MQNILIAILSYDADEDEAQKSLESLGIDISAADTILFNTPAKPPDALLLAAKTGQKRHVSVFGVA